MLKMLLLIELLFMSGTVSRTMLDRCRDAVGTRSASFSRFTTLFELLPSPI